MRCLRATRRRARDRCRSVRRARPSAFSAAAERLAELVRPERRADQLAQRPCRPADRDGPAGQGGRQRGDCRARLPAERGQLLPARRISVRDARAQPERAEVDRAEPDRPVLDRADRDLGRAAADIADRDGASRRDPGEGALEREAGLVLVREDPHLDRLARDSRRMSCGRVPRLAPRRGEHDLDAVGPGVARVPRRSRRRSGPSRRASGAEIAPQRSTSAPRPTTRFPRRPRHAVARPPPTSRRMVFEPTSTTATRIARILTAPRL